MKTSKPFASISYNTKAYLLNLLNTLVRNKVLSFYAVVYHYAEEDESKDHWHVYMQPSKLIQTDDICTESEELDMANPTAKPLRILPTKGTSKFADWYMYALHDEKYLKSKMLERKYHYKQEDFITSDDDFFAELIRDIDLSSLNGVEKLKTARKNGMRFTELVANGGVPIQQARNYLAVWDMLAKEEEFKYRDKMEEDDGEMVVTPIVAPSIQSTVYETNYGEVYDYVNADTGEVVLRHYPDEVPFPDELPY